MSSKLFKILILGVVFLSGINTGIFGHASESDLFISEVGFMGSTIGGGHDKWIELFNPSANQVNLSEYSLVIGVDPRVVSLSGTLESGNALVVSSVRDTTNSIFNTTGHYTLKKSWSPMSFLSNVTSNKHITASLNKVGVRISNINYGSSFVDSMISNFGENKGSIECGQNNSCWASTNTFYQGNFGTPGFASYVIVDRPLPPTPASSSVQTTPEITAPSINIQPEIVSELNPENVFEPSKSIENVTQPAIKSVGLENTPANNLSISLDPELINQPLVEKNAIGSKILENSDKFYTTNKSREIYSVTQENTLLDQTITADSKSVISSSASALVLQDKKSLGNSSLGAINISETLNLSPIDYTDFVVLLISGIYIESKKFGNANQFKIFAIINSR